MKRGGIISIFIVILLSVTIVSAVVDYPMKLINSSGKTFKMGSNKPVEGGVLSHSPEHDVKFTYNYYIGQYEVTKALWDEVAAWGATHGYSVQRTPQAKGENYPVYRLTWDDVKKWCNAFSAKEGLTPVYSASGQMNLNANGYRLPTEAEWEFAAKHDNSDWPDGDTYPFEDGGKLSEYGVFGSSTMPVGSKTAGNNGLFDMAGNVFEWVYENNYDYTSASQTNPVQPGPALYNPAGNYVHLARGGSYLSSSGRALVYRRTTQTASWAIEKDPVNKQYGFRVARNYVLPAACTSSDWSSVTNPEICPSSGQRTRTWNKTNQNCQNGVSHPATELLNCSYTLPWEQRDDDGDDVLNENDACSYTVSDARVNLKGCPLPEMTEFTSSFNLNNLNLESVNGFILENDEGSISFTGELTLIRSGDALDIDSSVEIGVNNISIDVEDLPELNKPALLTFKNVNIDNPAILVNGVPCSYCNITSFNNNVLKVSVPHFSSYQVVNQSHYDSLDNPPATNPPVVCSVNWNCTSWSNCSNSQQTRTCVDENGCDTEDGKPAESSTCYVINDKNIWPWILLAIIIVALIGFGGWWYSRKKIPESKPFPVRYPVR